MKKEQKQDFKNTSQKLIISDNATIKKFRHYI